MSDKQKQTADGLPSSLVREREVALSPGGPGDHPAALDGATEVSLPGWVEGGLAILDTKGCVLEANEALSHWLDRLGGSIVGHSFRALLEGRCSDWAQHIDALLDSSDPFASLRLALPSDASKASASFCLELARHGTVTFIRISSVLPPLTELEEAAWNKHLGPDSARREMFVRLVRAEKRLSCAAWREALSVLTMGLAHDFGNVMAGIHALSETLLDQVGPHQGFSEGLSLIKSNAQQASLLVRRIINLHQGRTGQSDYHNLNELAADAADLVRKILPRRMQFAVELAPDALAVHLDAVELRQVVINLVLNAVDAMPQTGRLVLRTSAYDKLPSLTQRQAAPPRTPAACLSIQDSGCGIKARHLPSIFDPFFTTKPMNKGSGLGLYNAKLFVEKHRGTITVDSQEGVGTTFHLWLPQADFSEAESAATHPVSPGTRRHLLLVGRSGGTLDGAAEFFRTHGYQVATSTSPRGVRDELHLRNCAATGLVVLAEPADKELLRLVPDVRRDHPHLRLILKVVGRDCDKLPPELVRQVDLIIPPDLSETRILEKLAKQF